MSEKKYSAGKLAYKGSLINPELLGEEERKEYGKAVKKFNEAVGTIMKINKENEELSEKAYNEVFNMSERNKNQTPGDPDE